MELPSTLETDLFYRKQPLHRDVFIHAFPMDADSPGDETPIFLLLRRSFLKSREPRKGNGNLAAVRQCNPEHIGREDTLTTSGSIFTAKVSMPLLLE
jgi:hypothetical protein